MIDKGIKRIIADEKLTSIGSLEAFLKYLEGPTWIFVPGKSHHSCRLLTTLLHGNEPSGSHAIFKLLKEKFIPAIDTWVLIASVSTALEKPIFSHRFKDGQQDLNRCFKSPWNTKIEKLAEQIMIDVASFEPELIIDVHNTSGAGPGFCVSTTSYNTIDKLVSIFCNSLVITHIKLGALMEVNFNCPILTVECGGNQSEQSHLFAYSGIKKYLSLDDISSEAKVDDLQYYHHPLRLELKEGYRLTYDTELQSDSDITLCHSVEEHNFGTTAPDERLGWLGDNGLECLQIMDSKQKNHILDFFQNIDGELYTRRPLHLFMVTTNHLIAKSDCLFYLTPAAALV